MHILNIVPSTTNMPYIYNILFLYLKCYYFLDDIFGNLSDDDIFKTKVNTSKKKTNDKPTKNQLFDDFKDPLADF